MLGSLSELRSRLLRHVVPLPYIYIGQHWRGDPRSRWDTVMSSRFSLVQELARQQHQTGFPAQHVTLRGKKNGKVASLELF